MFSFFEMENCNYCIRRTYIRTFNYFFRFYMCMVLVVITMVLMVVSMTPVVVMIAVISIVIICMGMVLVVVMVIMSSRISDKSAFDAAQAICSVSVPISTESIPTSLISHASLVTFQIYKDQYHDQSSGESVPLIPVTLCPYISCTE